MATLSAWGIGRDVYIKENNSWVAFTPVSINNPTYGKVLLKRKYGTKRMWFSIYASGEENEYIGSKLDKYLESEYFKTLDPYIQSKISYTTLKYHRYSTSDPTSFKRKVFTISYGDLGGYTNDGTEIPYLKTAVFPSTSNDFWLRTGDFDDEDAHIYVYVVKQNPSGGFKFYRAIVSEWGDIDSESDYYAMPFFELPSNIIVSSDGKIQENQPPTTPSSISFGTPYSGKPITITAGAATDPDNDTITYVYERQIDSGSWTQLASTTSRTYTTTVPTSGSRVNYRVKARDSVGNESSYRTGTAKTIIYNQAPPAPSSITYDTPNAGRILTISCSQVADPDGDPVTYIFERKVDDGAWIVISSTSFSTIEDVVPTEGTNYTVRVKARDPSNAESGYITGDTKEIQYELTLTDPGKPRYKYAISGDQMPVKWAHAAAPGGNKVTYTLERKIDNGEWEVIGYTFDNFYSVEVPETTGTESTITVRLKASTPDGHITEYQVGDTINILWHKIVRRIPWEIGTPFKIRQFTANERMQLQTKTEGALAEAPANPEIEINEEFGLNSPGQIQEAIRTGKYKTLWSIGDEIVIPFYDGNYIFRIADFDHDQITRDTHKAAITLELKDLISTKKEWDIENPSTSIYVNSGIFEFVENDLLPTIDRDWYSIMVPVDKIYYAGKDDPLVDTHSLWMFIPTEKEVFGSSYIGEPDEGEQYKLYATASNRGKRLSNGGGDASVWWTSSVSKDSRNISSIVEKNGSNSISEKTNQNGVSIMICIGYAPDEN